MNKSIAQRIVARNKEFLTLIQEGLVWWKNRKRLADEQGDIEEEYISHNRVKALRKDLAKAVLEQRELKRVINGK